MQALETVLYPIVVKVNEYLSSYILIVLLIAVGLWYTIKTRFVQIRYFKEGIKKVFGNLSLRGGKQQQGMSSFQALTTAIAAQVGTGNIIGASGAILTGGPGAIFWMWVIAFFGMATIYAEATLALKTRKIDKNGNILGGPVYYITAAFEGGLGKFLAGFFMGGPGASSGQQLRKRVLEPPCGGGPGMRATTKEKFFDGSSRLL